MIFSIYMFYRNRDIIDEENPYDAVTIEEDTKIYEDLVSYQKVPVRLLHPVCLVFSAKRAEIRTKSVSRVKIFFFFSIF